MTRDLANQLTVAHWDFRRDGTVCARFLGGKSNDPCADEGRWQMSGDALCWELQRIGETYGYKKACMQVRRLDDKRYEGVPGDGKLHPPLFMLLR